MTTKWRRRWRVFFFLLKGPITWMMGSKSAHKRLQLLSLTLMVCFQSAKDNQPTIEKCIMYAICLPPEARVSLERNSYWFNENVGMLKVCADVYSPFINCPITFAFIVNLLITDDTTGSIYTYIDGSRGGVWRHAPLEKVLGDLQGPPYPQPPGSVPGRYMYSLYYTQFIFTHPCIPRGPNGLHSSICCFYFW